MAFRLNDYFDKILCVNLDIRKDRWDDCIELFQKHNIDVERIPGVYGKKLGILEKHTGSWYLGSVGATISHLFALKYAKQLNLRNVLILEDDICFLENINEKFNEITAEIPTNWDMLYLGGTHYSAPQKVSKHIYKIDHVLGATAIAINGHFLNTAIAYASRIDQAIDLSYKMLQEKYNVYITNPHLVWQYAGYSTIDEMYVEYPDQVSFPAKYIIED